MISALFSPYVTALVFIILISYHYSRNLSQFLPWMVTFLLFAIIIPGFYVLWLLESRQIRDIHISDKNDRKIPFLLAGVSSVIGAFLLFILGAAKPVTVIGVAYAVNVIAVALLTQVWKVSIHTALYSAIVTTSVILFGIHLWWLYLFLIPLAWSRIHRKRHTIWQAVAGSLIAFVLTAATFWFFGYL
ncbi:MAG: hypothetical protein US31_C0002G0014 [Berkelbacteria bacterium GW2011_GWA1_36_9]|uniref:Phosphatidic acid phosphatase type 2/haloperoxidase domain-containing protein n=1 Tax=Berkelbacteria bacterium GW2011_GWA1_36_9 TaxID=1618331 RepID=A0A0G0I343_9BACT|nr:MAG: hypothetical protein US31_C0002G0014 [Berkelbacteria bacterium GW2011_GWA1_36_9]